MNTENKISIKKVIADFPLLAKGLLRKDEHAIEEFANECKLSSTFIKQNLQLISNWI